MADVRNPPPGPPARDPTAPARLLDAAAEVGLRVVRAQRDLDRLEGSVERLAQLSGLPPMSYGAAPTVESPGPDLDDQAAPAQAGAVAIGGSVAHVPAAQQGATAAARAYAIDLAVGGASHSAIREQLRLRFSLVDTDAVMSDVLAPRESREREASSAAEADTEGDPAVSRDAAAVPEPEPVGAEGATAPGPNGQERAMLPAALQTYGTQLGMAALSLVNALVMARALGATGRGEVVFLTTVAFLGSNVWTLGVQEANVNLAGAEPATRRSLATNSLWLSLLLGAAGALLIALLITIVPAAGAGVSWTLLWVILATLPVLILGTYLRFLIQGSFGFGITNLAWIMPSVVNVAVTTVLAIAGSLTVGLAVLTWVAGQTVAVLVLVAHVVRRMGGFGRPSASLARRTLGFGVKSHAGRVMLIANYRLDQWLLGAIGGTKQLGVYSIAVAFAEGLFLLPTALSAVQRPTIVRATKDAAIRLTAKVFRVSLLITAAFAAALAALAPILCVTIFGEDFRDSVVDLRVLVCGAFGVVALKQLGNALTGRDHPVAASMAIGSAFVFTIVLDVVLIPEYGDLGAAIASSVAYTFGGVVIALVFVRTLGGRLRDLVPRPSDLTAIADMARRIARR